MRGAVVLAAALGLIAVSAVQAQAPAALSPAPPRNMATPTDAKDLSGLWVVSNRSTRGWRDEKMASLSGELLTPAAKAKKAKNLPALDPSAQCLPSLPRHLGGPYPIHVTQSPSMLVMLFEYDTVFRIIYLDDRERPDPDDYRFMGFSLGRWEGDTLVVETTNLNEKAWLGADGTPTTPTTKLTERFRRIENGKTLELTLKVEDPATFVRPVYQRFLYNFKPDWEIKEYFCADGNRDDPLNQKEGQPGSLGGAPAAK